MKVEKIVEEKGFTPFSIKVTFESQADFDALLRTLGKGYGNYSLYTFLIDIQRDSK